MEKVQRFWLGNESEKQVCERLLKKDRFVVKSNQN